MPRFKESRTFTLLRDVPANCVRLVKEALSLRQKIVSERQCIHFLRRCLQCQVVPKFITNKRLHETCGLEKGSRQVKDIEQRLLRIALKSKQNNLFSMLLKCVCKEECCKRFVPEYLWRRIVGESKIICNVVRSDAKSRLQEKFNRLVDRKLDQSVSLPVSAMPSSRSVMLSSDYSGKVSTPPRVSVIGDVNLSDNALSLLDLGPSFAPAHSIGPQVTRKIVGTLQCVHDRLRSKAMQQEQDKGRGNTTGTTLPPIPFRIPFSNHKDLIPWWTQSFNCSQPQFSQF